VDPESADPEGFGVRTGAVRASAGAIGGVVTALAIFLPLLIPTLSFHVFDFGNGPGGDGDINIENPMVDLRRDLSRGEDVALLQVTTDDPNPSYMRIGVLNRYEDDEWSSGDRDVPSSNRASGRLPELVGVANTVTREEFEYDVFATSDFRSTWLPTQPQISRIEADGDWRFDPATMDFLASDDDLDTSGLRYDFTAVSLSLDADALARARSTGGLIGSQFIELLVNLLDTQNVMIGILLRAVKRAELAIDIADIGVIHVTINNVGHDLAAAPIVCIVLGGLAAVIRKRSKLLQGQPIQRVGLVLRYPRAIEYAVHHIVFLQSRWHFLNLYTRNASCP